MFRLVGVGWWGQTDSGRYYQLMNASHNGTHVTF